MTNLILMFLHLTAAAIGVGSLVYAVFLFLPAMDKIPESLQPGQEERSPQYRALDILGPTVFACVLVLIGTGTYYLLENYTEQAGLKPGYYNLFGVKMLFVIGSFFLSLYIAFPLRQRIANLDLSPENRVHVPVTLARIRSIARLLLGLILMAVFCGIWLVRY
ncbi:MAG: hypothetical protein COV67_07680 [Nitrospinae bacterium CG11_big_fil_rev_8_21_14_0_20_56_8]|nr:MAG: hypothetical protein COV67_07680 [Nitrospinae bacterium CG11_big_fil_rev_8_21_14_0_20_56_8]